MYMWLQNSIWSNRLKTIYLLLLFPLFLFWLIYLGFLLSNIFGWSYSYIVDFFQKDIQNNWWLCQTQNAQICARNYYLKDALDNTLSIFMILWPILLIWCLISFIFYRQIIFKFSWAKPITRQENPEIYNIVENLCISKWILVDQDISQQRWIKIWIIQDSSMNAFATGWDTKNAWIVFSSWLIEKLNKQEIEAVAAHELTHIINKDSLLMIVIVVFIWAIATLWEIALRVWLNMKSDNSKDSWKAKWLIIFVWVILMILWYLVFPLVQLAVSRRREYLADAWSVEITKDKFAMINALQKISQDSVIESIKKQTVASMCIASPFWPDLSFFSRIIKSIFSTHPSIEDRIKALESY